MASTKIQEFLRTRGVKPECELCGQNNWSLPEDDTPITVSLGTEQRNPQNALYPLAKNAILTYPAVCINCGNIRLHAQAIVDKPKGLLG
jgi:hypothetical protein